MECELCNKDIKIMAYSIGNYSPVCYKCGKKQEDKNWAIFIFVFSIIVVSLILLSHILGR